MEPVLVPDDGLGIAAGSDEPTVEPVGDGPLASVAVPVAPIGSGTVAVDKGVPGMTGAPVGMTTDPVPIAPVPVG